MQKSVEKTLGPLDPRSEGISPNLQASASNGLIAEVDLEEDAITSPGYQETPHCRALSPKQQPTGKDSARPEGKGVFPLRLQGSASADRG